MQLAIAVFGLFCVFLALLLWSWLGRSLNDTRPVRDPEATRNRSVGFGRRYRR